MPRLTMKTCALSYFLLAVLILPTVNRRLSIQIPVTLHGKCTPYSALSKLSTKSFPLIFFFHMERVMENCSGLNSIGCTSTKDQVAVIASLESMSDLGICYYACHRAQWHCNITKNKHTHTTSLPWRRSPVFNAESHLPPHSHGSRDSSWWFQTSVKQQTKSDANRANNTWLYAVRG